MTFVIHHEVFSDAPIEKLWHLLSDATTWSSWTMISRTTLEETAPSGDPNGVGALRHFASGPRASRERVVAFEPPTHLAYELVSGLPITGYRADVTLTSLSNGGTSIVWHAEYSGRPRLVGAALHSFLSWFLHDTAKRLARAATRSA